MSKGFASNFSFNFKNPTGSSSTASKPTFSFGTSKPAFNFGTLPTTAAAAAPATTPAATATPTPTASTATPAASTATPSISTSGTAFTSTKVTIQAKNGSTSQGNSMSIFSNDKFKQFSPLEIRVFDYVSQNKVGQLKPAPPPPQAAATADTSSISSAAKLGSSLLNTRLVTDTSKSTGTSFNTSYVNKNTEEDGLTEADIQNAQGIPSTIPAKISTAEEFFKPNIPKLKRTQVSEISIRHDDQPQFVDYSILFKPRISLTHRSKSVITPIIITSKMLQGDHEEEPSTLKYAPTYDEEEEFSNDEKPFHTVEEEDLPYSFSNVVPSDELTLYPPLKKIQTLSSVKNFRISKDTIAAIDFLSPVDISNFNFKKDIIIRNCLVDIYRIKRNAPKKGTGMNVRAMINMQSVWPKNSSGIRVKTNNQKVLSQYDEQLKSYCEKKNAQPIFYLKDKGIFQFIVSDFTNGPYDLP